MCIDLFLGLCILNINHKVTSVVAVESWKIFLPCMYVGISDFSYLLSQAAVILSVSLKAPPKSRNKNLL